MRAPAHHRRAADWLDRAGISHERCRYARPEAAGETAAVRLLPRGAPRGRVLVAHGAGNDALFPLVALAAALVRRGFEVFSFDLDGNGWESTTRFDPETAPGAVAAALDAAGRGRPRVPVHLLGHSLGGALALGFLGTARGGEVASATLVSAPLEVRIGLRGAVGELAGFFSRAALGQCALYGVWGTVPAVGPLKRAAYPFRHAASGRPLAYIDAVRDLLRRMELERAAEGVRVPTLLVYGSADGLSPPEHGERLAARIAASELRVIGGASHFTAVFAPETTDAVVSWVERWTPGEGVSTGDDACVEAGSTDGASSIPTSSKDQGVPSTDAGPTTEGAR